MAPLDPDGIMPMGRAGVMLNSWRPIQVLPLPARFRVLEGRTKSPTRLFGLRSTARAMVPFRKEVSLTFRILYLAPSALAKRLARFKSSAKRADQATSALGQFDMVRGWNQILTMDIKLNVSRHSDTLTLDVKASMVAAEELGQALRAADMGWYKMSGRYVALKRLKDASHAAGVEFDPALDVELEKLSAKDREKERLRTKLRQLNTYMAVHPMELKRQMAPKPVVRRTPPSNRAFIPYPAGPVNPNEVVFSIPENMEPYN